MPMVGFVAAFASSENDLIGVDHHDVVAAIHVRGEERAMLAANDLGYLDRQTSDDKPFGIDKIPLRGVQFRRMNVCFGTCGHNNIGGAIVLFRL